MELKKQQNERKTLDQTLVQHAALGSIMVRTKLELAAVLCGVTCRMIHCEM